MSTSPIDCACVIHGEKYDWIYVERLHRMLLNNVNGPVNLHVFTEPDRLVPADMIKHDLQEWPGISGPKKSWWYKMQMFNPQHGLGKVLYFDLDVVITTNLAWILELDPGYFWAIRDFRHLWRSSWKGMNSSVMMWDNALFPEIWQDFSGKNIAATTKLFHGDQDYLDSVVPEKKLRFFDEKFVKSWRWQIKDGGLDFNTRVYRRPDAGSVLDPNTRIIIFHGNPKPHEINDPAIVHHWAQSQV